LHFRLLGAARIIASLLALLPLPPARHRLVNSLSARPGNHVPLACAGIELALWRDKQLAIRSDRHPPDEGRN
jgi:hypothetical protein